MKALREALKETARTPFRTFTTILTIALAMLLLGVFGFITAYSYGFANNVKKSEEISVYLKDDLSNADMLALDSAISSITGVGTTKIVSKEDAAREFEKMFGNNLLSSLEDNPLPRSIQIVMAPGYRMVKNFETVANRITPMKGVDTVEYGREWIAKAETFLLLLLGVETVLFLLVIVSSILIIANTIGLAVVARHDTIEVMRLVGATEGFIRLPFYLEGIVQGLCAGIIASAILVGACFWMEYNIPDLSLYLYMAGAGAMDFRGHEWYITSLIPLGAFLGLLGSFLAVRRTI
ncbi:MAG: ABC transporter permease [Candidatus Latescibacterota bacterium]